MLTPAPLGAPPSMIFTIDRIAMGSCVGNEGSTQVRRCSLRPSDTVVPVLGTRDTVIAMKRLNRAKAIQYCERADLFTLDHSNINKVLGWVPEKAILLLQLSEEGSLSMESFKKLPIDEQLLQTVVCCLQVAEGLQYLHDRGMCHLGVKPANVLRFGDTFKLCDFGTSKGVDDCNDLDTFAYAAPELYPEIAHDEASADADLYSLGCLLCELVTNQLLWGTDDVEVIQTWVCDGRSPDALQRAWPSWCPENILKLARTLVSFNPSDRGEIATVVDSLRSTVNWLQALKANSMQLFNASSPYGSNWLQTVDELSSLTIALAGLAGINAPANRPDLACHALSIATPHVLVALQALPQIHSLTCEHRKIIALYTAESPICYLLNGTLSQLNCPVADLERIAPVAKRLYIAVQRLGKRYNGDGFRVLYADAPHLRAVHANYETQLSCGSSLNSFQFSSFTADIANIPFFTNSSRSMILLQCRNLIGFDIDDLSNQALTGHPREKEVLVLPPAYFTIKTTPYKLNNVVIVELEYHERESQEGCYSTFERRGDDERISEDSLLAHLKDAASQSLANAFEASHPYVFAAAAGDMGVLQELVAAEHKTCSDHIDATELIQAHVRTATLDGETPLYAAASCGHIDVIRKLFILGAEVPVTANNGLSPLHAAAQGGHVAAVAALLEKGAGKTDAYRVDVLHIPCLCARAFLQLLNMLNVQPSVANNSRFTAAAMGSLRSRILNAMRDKISPLCVAASQGHMPVLDVFIETFKHFETSEIVLSLIAAAMGNHLDAINCLVPLVLNNGWYRAPLMAAAIVNSNRTIIDRLRLLGGSAVDEYSQDVARWW